MYNIATVDRASTEKVIQNLAFCVHLALVLLQLAGYVPLVYPNVAKVEDAAEVRRQG